MNRSRTREFDQFRSNAASSLKSETASNLSRSTVSEACVNCVNQIIAKRKHEQKIHFQEQERSEYRKMYFDMRKSVDSQFNFRNEMKKEALRENEEIIERHRKQKQLQKQEDRAYAKQVQVIVRKADQEKKREEQELKEKQAKYFRQIQEQYLLEEAKRKEKKIKKEDVNDGTSLPLWHDPRHEQRMNYGKELLSQIEEKKRMSSIEENLAKEKEKKLMKEFQRESLKHHADNYQQKRFTREEYQKDYESHQAKKLWEQERNRREEENLKLEMIRRENEEKSKAIQRKMQEMQSYVSTLKYQMFDKQKKLRESKISDTRFVETLAKSTQQIEKEMQVKKQCRGCHKQVPLQMISSVPRKA